MPQAQTGHSPALKSIPKICRINGDDNRMIVYRNLGNNHAYPFIWGDSFAIDPNETTLTIASGIKFHGYTLVEHGNVVVTPDYNAGAFWVEKNVDTDEIIYHCTQTPVSGTIDVQFMLGHDAEIEKLYCRGTGKGMPSFP